MKARDQLQAHVVDVQRTVRSCAGCGLCCTVEHNAVAILPIEAERIAAHLETLPMTRRQAFRRRVSRVIQKFRLRTRVAAFYTCPFLERDFTCALPMDVKPTACLSFNPLHAERCEQEAGWFHRVHDDLERENQRRGLTTVASPIPVAIRDWYEHGDPPRA